MAETSPEWFEHVVNKDYAEFSKVIKNDLKTRLANHPEVQKYLKQEEYYKNISGYMKSIPTVDEYVNSEAQEDI